MAQDTNLENQSPYTANLPNAATQADQLSLRTDPSIIGLFNEQQAIQRNKDTLISKFSDLQAQYKNDHFLAI